MHFKWLGAWLLILAAPIGLAQNAVTVPGQGAGASVADTGVSSSRPAVGNGVSSPTMSSVPVITNQSDRSRALSQNPSRPNSNTQDPRQQSPQDPRQQAAEIPQRNEFQEMVAISLGKDLPLFGAELFQGVPTTFAPVENIPVTPDYTIGPGDEILIRAWGQIDVDYKAVVDRNGSISIPRVGVINVSGIRYQALEDYIRNAFSRNFRNFDLTVSLGQLRSIQILVVGQARRPGSYTVSSLSTLINAIFAAGGPTSRGSMRAIQLKRGNKTIAEMDLYELLAFGDKSRDQQLLPGDVIYFPPIGPLAALAGSVNSQAVFELKAETTVGQLLRWSGGLSTTAQTRMASVERIVDRTARTVEQFALDQSGMQKPVRDGDLISVFSITPRFENVVSLRGNVAAPLRYPFRQGMRVRDLIPERDALITADYYLRRNALVRPDVQAPVAGNRVSELRNLAEINWDYASIERLDPNDLSTQLIPFNLAKAILNGDPAHNLELRPGDVLNVYSKNDIAVPLRQRTKFVRLEGEFAQSGIYQIAPGETLRQLVSRIGGLTEAAYLYGSELTRESTRQQQQQTLEESINRLEADMQRASVSQTRSLLNPEDAAAIKQEAETRRALIEKLRTVKATGRIVLAMGENARVAELPDLPLEDGDRFYVPSQPSTVQVVGAVFSPAALVFRTGQRVSDYLLRAGGPTKEADNGSIYVLKADGTVASARQSGWLFSTLEGRAVMPGDSIVVPEDFERTPFMRKLKDVAQIFYQFGLGAAAIKVLKN